jgi:hypothetical protein
VGSSCNPHGLGGRMASGDITTQTVILPAAVVTLPIPMVMGFPSHQKYLDAL